MNAHVFLLADTPLHALPEGALWVPDSATLVVSDLHLGKSERLARRGGSLLPPYENRATLDKLDRLLDQHRPTRVVCLGDSFDDVDASLGLSDVEKVQLMRQQAGRDWVWIEGNHDPGPIDLGGRHLVELTDGPITYRHIAQPGAQAEVSGHYHPKCGVGPGGTRPAFLIDRTRVILPAFGAYTGGLRASHPTLTALMSADACAILTGRRAMPVPLSATC